MRYSHVVFDIDGTLIDSESAILKSLQKIVLEEKGVKKNLDELKFSLGIPGKYALEKLEIEDFERVEERWNEYFNDYSDEVDLFVQVRQVVQVLKSNGIKLGIITSKTKKEYEDDFLRFGLHPYFDVVICADDTKKHKPDGEPMEKYLEITNAKASSPPAAHPVVTIKPAPIPTLNPASIVDTSILVWGNIGPIDSNISYKIEKLNDANIEYIKNFFPKYLYPINKSDTSIIIFATSGWMLYKFFNNSKTPNTPPSVILFK